VTARLLFSIGRGRLRRGYDRRHRDCVGRGRDRRAASERAAVDVAERSSGRGPRSFLFSRGLASARLGRLIDPGRGNGRRGRSDARTASFTGEDVGRFTVTVAARPDRLARSAGGGLARRGPGVHGAGVSEMAASISARRRRSRISSRRGARPDSGGVAQLEGHLSHGRTSARRIRCARWSRRIWIFQDDLPDVEASLWTDRGDACAIDRLAGTALVAWLATESVALLGKPNVGKSSDECPVGRSALVSGGRDDRDYLEERSPWPARAPLGHGICLGESDVERAGVERSRERLCRRRHGARPGWTRPLDDEDRRRRWPPRGPPSRCGAGRPPSPGHDRSHEPFASSPIDVSAHSGAESSALPRHEATLLPTRLREPVTEDVVVTRRTRRARQARRPGTGGDASGRTLLEIVALSFKRPRSSSTAWWARAGRDVSTGLQQILYWEVNQPGSKMQEYEIIVVGAGHAGMRRPAARLGANICS
jgi:hypothetical protein